MRTATSRLLLILAVLPACSNDCDDDEPRDAAIASDAAISDGGVRDAESSQVPKGCDQELDPTVATRFYDAVRCLFEGPNAVQRELKADQLSEERIAVVRGRVLAADGTALAGVRVSVHAGEAYGHTLTRSGGHYDLAVNGGGTITLRFELAGHLSVQRQMPTSWRKFTVFPDVVLLPVSGKAQHVDLASMSQMTWVEGPHSDDSSGSRQHVLLVRPGTRATMTLADGSEGGLDAFDVHVTEYTVGERGQQAMPGDLPATSGYTYAVDFTVPQAREAGAKRVAFDPPLITYVDNFLRFPAGTLVPNGAYDAERDAWTASANGLVVAVIGREDGRATLDISGDGEPDDASALAALGIDDAELRAVADRYEPGDSLWRVPIEHFSPWDHNWPFGPPADATAALLDVLGFPPDGCGSTRSGSIVDCEAQSLGEEFPLDGVPYTLHYQSERMPGRSDARALEVRVSGDTVPASLKRIELEVEVLGQLVRQTFDAQPSQRTTLRWDGLDAYGRKQQGRHEATIRAGYVYDGSYQRASGFAQPGDGVPITGDRSRAEVTLWSTWKGLVGNVDQTGMGLGGFSLNVHHVYDPNGRALYRGDGRTIRVEALGDSIDTYVGTGEPGFSGDDGAATKAQLNGPHGVVLAPDGTAYISDENNHRIRRVRLDGVIDTYAGNGRNAPLGDGGPAGDAAIESPLGLALGRDGTLYVAQRTGRVRAIAPDGTIRTVAGGGAPADGRGDGMPATLARFREPHALAIGPDGTLYVADAIDDRIRRIGTDGVITTFAGGGSVLGDNGPATQALVDDPLGLALGPDGSLYVTEYDSHRLRKIDPSGTISTYAGTGRAGFAGDGGPAVEAQLRSPHTVDVSRDGTVYVTDEGNRRVRRIRPDGVIETIAGNGNSHGSGDTAVGDLGPARAATFNTPRVVYLHQDGTLWIADFGDGRVRRIRAALPGFTLGETLIGAPEGTEAYRFDGYGRHRETVDTLMGLVLRSFEYDASGRLRAIVEQHGQRTEIERSADGAPTAIVGPYGHTTRLSVDSAGLLASLKRPNGEETRFSFAPGGLLTELERPGSGGPEKTTFEYDADGRLVRDVSPSGVAQTISRETLPTGQRVTRTLGGDRREVFETTNAANGDATRVHTGFEGQITKTVRSADRTEVTTVSRTMRATRVGDSRFGLISPINAESELLDGPIRLTTKQSRAVTLSDPQNPLVVGTLNEERSANDRRYTSSWNGQTRTWESVSPGGRVMRTTLDDRGRVIAEELVGTAPIQYRYDERGRVIQVEQLGAGTSFGYGDDGALETITDALGRTQRYEHDANGRTTAVVLADDARIELTYDASDQLKTLSPPGRARHAFQIGQGGVLQSYERPQSGGTSEPAFSYAYDKFLQLESVSDRDGEMLRLSFEPATGRPLRIQHEAGGVTLAYDDRTAAVRQVTAGDTVLDFSYDGTLLTSIAASGAVAGTVSRRYDRSGWVESQAVAGRTSTFARDADGLLVTAGELTLARDPTTGAITGTSLAGVVDAYSYDGAGRITDYSATSMGVELYARGDERDALGRVVRRTERVQGEERLLEYDYDLRGRVVAVRVDGETSESYAYDANGNRVRSAYLGQPELEASFGASDELLRYGGTSFTHDAAGNLTSSSDGARYSYDALGQLRRATTSTGKVVEYVVDGLNRRAGKKLDGTLTRSWLYDFEGRVVAETPGSTASSSSSSVFVYASRRHVPDFMLKGSRRYRLISDALGSVRLVVDLADGSVVQRLAYDTFGRVLEDTNPGFQPFGFAGGIYDADTRLVRFGAREYAAEIGRWTAPDPVLFSGRQANLYTYVGNDPVNSIDPSGLIIDTIWDAISVAAGVATLAHDLGCGDYESAAWSGLALGVDVVAALLPFVPGGASAARSACRAGVCSGIACFAAGTAVATADGPRSIETIAPGMQVEAIDPATGEWGLHEVTRTFAREVDGVLALELVDDDATDVLQVTLEHPFYERQRGWTPAKDLEPGSQVRTQGGAWIRVGAATWIQRRQLVYNLEVDEAHTYFVGGSEVWVHNSCGLEDLARFRHELGLAEGQGTLARLDVGGRSFYGINAHGQPVNLRVNPISRTHAETDAFQQAANAGVNGGQGTLFVDRGLCTACGDNGAVRSLARQLGFDQLEVVTPHGVEVIRP
jgi:RHS repeat-associated protein